MEATQEVPQEEIPQEEVPKEETPKEVPITNPPTKKLTKKETAKILKEKAIENFKNGVDDVNYRVVKMTNGKYRCYPKDQNAPVEPISLKQVPENKHIAFEIPPAKEPEQPIDEEPKKGKKKVVDPMNDIIYYNLNSQINEQINKRIDDLTKQLDSIHDKHRKLKGKYKQLKQAIFIDGEEEEAHEQQPPPQQEQVHEEPVQPVQQQQPMYGMRGRRNFNDFFN